MTRGALSVLILVSREAVWLRARCRRYCRYRLNSPASACIAACFSGVDLGSHASAMRGLASACTLCAAMSTWLHRMMRGPLHRNVSKRPACAIASWFLLAACPDLCLLDSGEPVHLRLKMFVSRQPWARMCRQPP